MPYENFKQLPTSIQEVLPVAGQKLFLEVFNRVYSSTKSEAKAMQAAWSIIKKRFRKSGEMWVASSYDFEAPQLYVFEMHKSDKEFIVNSEEDEIVIDAVLADTTPRKGDGKWFTIEALEAIANQINARGSTSPDVEHAVLAGLRDMYVPNERLPQELVKGKGMLNKIVAAVKDGKLWIQAWLDKKYEKIIQLYKFLSIEALARSRDDDGLEDPEYLGFTFTQNPRLPDAQIAGW